MATGKKARKSTKKKERTSLSKSGVGKENKKKRNKDLEQAGHSKKKSKKKKSPTVSELVENLEPRFALSKSSASNRVNIDRKNNHRNDQPFQPTDYKDDLWRSGAPKSKKRVKEIKDMKEHESWSELSIDDSFSIYSSNQVDNDDEKTSGKNIFENDEDHDMDFFQVVNDSSCINLELFQSIEKNLPFCCYECKCIDKRKDRHQHDVSRSLQLSILF